jgi:beta-N-acetylhexosaminidase
MSAGTQSSRVSGRSGPGLIRDAYAVLLPAHGGLDFEDARGFFESGGVSFLLGCSLEEYRARKMSKERQQEETAVAFRSFVEKAKRIAGNVVIAVDHELGGVQRLQAFAPYFSSPADVVALPAAQIEEHGRQVGTRALELGVNLLLSPVVDVVIGPNPWLTRRSLSSDPAVVAEYACAYIRGLQSKGLAATAKHFPGHPEAPLDSHDHDDANVPFTLDALQPGFAAFVAAIGDGVKAVMTGPMLVPALDPVRPASRSTIVVDLLRKKFGFSGLIISDDLDLKGTMRGDSIEDTAVDSLRAGVDLLLLSAGPQVDDVAAEIVEAVADGRVSRARLTEAADAVRRFATDLP